jgi:hypothetical protein
MPHYTYLIIGGGMTADAAVHGIRQRAPTVPLAPSALNRTRPMTVHLFSKDSGKERL